MYFNSGFFLTRHKKTHTKNHTHRGDEKQNQNKYLWLKCVIARYLAIVFDHFENSNDLIFVIWVSITFQTVGFRSTLFLRILNNQMRERETLNWHFIISKFPWIACASRKFRNQLSHSADISRPIEPIVRDFDFACIWLNYTDMYLIAIIW